MLCPELCRASLLVWGADQSMARLVGPCWPSPATVWAMSCLDHANSPVLWASLGSTTYLAISKDPHSHCTHFGCPPSNLMRICTLSPHDRRALTDILPPPLPLTLQKGAPGPPPFTHPPTRSSASLSLYPRRNSSSSSLPSKHRRRRFRRHLWISGDVAHTYIIATSRSTMCICHLHRNTPVPLSSASSSLSANFVPTDDPREVNRLLVTPSLSQLRTSPPTAMLPNTSDHRSLSAPPPPEPCGCHVTPPGRHACARLANPSPIIACM